VELESRKTTTSVDNGFCKVNPILVTTNMRSSRDKAGTTNIPCIPINLINGTESSG
jgi:hypothetical protein